MQHTATTGNLSVMNFFLSGQFAFVGGYRRTSLDNVIHLYHIYLPLSGIVLSNSRNLDI
jgi:hypothetical protein